MSEAGLFVALGIVALGLGWPVWVALLAFGLAVAILVVRRAP